MKNFKIVTFTFILVIINGLSGHFLPPLGLILNPVIIITISTIIIYGTNMPAIWKSSLSFVFTVLCDVSIKLYAGGDHDTIGRAIQNLLLFSGVLTSWSTLLFILIKNKSEKAVYKIIALILYIVLFIIYFYFFKDLGAGKSYPGYLW